MYYFLLNRGGIVFGSCSGKRSISGFYCFYSFYANWKQIVHRMPSSHVLPLGAQLNNS